MASAYNLRNLSALVVDDYAPMRTILRGILKEFGIGRVVEAIDGQDAIDELAYLQPDVIFTDYMMEPINGLQLIDAIRHGDTPVDRFVPIVMVSAYTEVKEILAARDSGVSEYLAKPISGKLVYYRLRSIIENPRPFVEADRFFGPDRRRNQLEVEYSDRRQSEYEYRAPTRKSARD